MIVRMIVGVFKLGRDCRQSQILEKTRKNGAFSSGLWAQMPNLGKTGENPGKIRAKVGKKAEKRRKNERIEWKKIGVTRQRLCKIVVVLIDWV